VSRARCGADGGGLVGTSQKACCGVHADTVHCAADRHRSATVDPRMWLTRRLDGLNSQCQFCDARALFRPPRRARRAHNMATAAVEVEALSKKLSELLGKHPEVSLPFGPPSEAPSTVNEAVAPCPCRRTGPHAACSAPDGRGEASLRSARVFSLC
jgi:hypothetical protein